MLNWKSMKSFFFNLKFTIFNKINKKINRKTSEPFEAVTKSANVESPFISQSTPPLNPEPWQSQVKFNYSFLNPNSYSLMKFINSSSNSRANEFRDQTTSFYHRPATSAFANSIIKPSRLANSVLSNQRTIKQESEMNWRPCQDSLGE